MWPLLIAGAVGALAMGKALPKTKCEKKTLLGPVTGMTYEVEDFREAGFITVKAPDGSTGTFEYAAKASTPNARGFVWRQGRGQPKTLNGMIFDLAPRSLTPPAKEAEKKP